MGEGRFDPKEMGKMDDTNAVCASAIQYKSISVSCETASVFPGVHGRALVPSSVSEA